MSSSVGTWWYSGACHELPYNRYGQQCIMGQPNGRAIADSFSVERHFKFWDTVNLWKWWERGRNARLYPAGYVSSGLSAIYGNAAANWSVVLSRGSGVPGQNEYAVFGFPAAALTQAQCEAGVGPTPPTPTQPPAVTPTPTPTPGGGCTNTQYVWLPDGRCAGLPCGTVVDGSFCSGTNPTPSPTRTPSPNPTPTPTPPVQPPNGSKCYRHVEVPCPVSP